MPQSKLEETQPLRPNFERERDPLHAKAMDDLNKTEAQRRREATAYENARAKRRESFMVKRQKPQPVLRPSPSQAYASDHASFNAQWDAEKDMAKRANQQAAALQEAYAVKRQLQNAKAVNAQARSIVGEARAPVPRHASQASRRAAFKAERASSKTTERALRLAEQFHNKILDR
ncbi:MAG: hypothetical protein AAGB16_09595 [Pseudomonadota bacterium]